MRLSEIDFYGKSWLDDLIGCGIHPAKALAEAIIDLENFEVKGYTETLALEIKHKMEDIEDALMRLARKLNEEARAQKEGAL